MQALPAVEVNPKHLELDSNLHGATSFESTTMVSEVGLLLLRVTSFNYQRGAASSSLPSQLALQGAQGQVTSSVPILGALLEAASPAYIQYDSGTTMPLRFQPRHRNHDLLLGFL